MKYRLSCSTGPPLYILKLASISGIKSLIVYFNGLLIIKPIDPSLLWSANKITDLLKDKSPIIEGSAISRCPFFNFSEIIRLQFLLNLIIKKLKSQKKSLNRIKKPSIRKVLIIL